MKKQPFRLVNEALSHDTIAALEQLCNDAKDGNLIGIAFAAMYKGRRYVVDSAGEAYRSPTFCLGMIDMLAAETRAMERGDK